MTIMSELGPRAREILRSGRDLNRPTAADRERIDSALRERLGAGLLANQGSNSGQSSSAIRPRWPFLKAFVVGAGLLGGGLFFASKQPSGATSTPHAVVSAATTNGSQSAAPSTELAAPEAAKAQPPRSEPESLPLPVAAAKPSPSTRPTEDRLAQEVALLARATSSLHAGHPAEALKVLDEYQHRFPKGLLTEERRAAKAQALCALGRQSEAEGELARLTPHSLAAARAKQFCAGPSASKP
ncbi:MAG TPA: hypothetical protein VFK05_09385 [Polyangiaceae bacterium]|nr:hypothetical protein [Polyangiaceae bacterium]